MTQKNYFKWITFLLLTLCFFIIGLIFIVIFKTVGSNGRWNIEKFFNKSIQFNLDQKAENEKNIVDLISEINENLNFKLEKLLFKTNRLYISKPPKRLIDIEKLELDIKNIIGEEIDNYGIYIHDLKRKQTVKINEKKIFPPMSISKLPVAIMTLREIEKGNLKLDQQFMFDWQSVADPTNILKPYFIGNYYSIDQYLNFLLVESDNASILKLESLLGGYQLLNEHVKTELGVEYFFRYPHDVTSNDVGLVWVNIYKKNYLSDELNNYLINLLRNTSPFLQDGIPEGVPMEYRNLIAHKTGQGASNPGYIWSDSGIVYGPESDYVIVVLNDFIDIDLARYKIQEISKLVWDITQTNFQN